MVTQLDTHLSVRFVKRMNSRGIDYEGLLLHDPE